MDNDRTTDRKRRVTESAPSKSEAAAIISQWDHSAPHRMGVITQVRKHPTGAEVDFHLHGEPNSGFSIAFEIDMEVPRLLIYSADEEAPLISIHATESGPIIRTLKVT